MGLQCPQQDFLSDLLPGPQAAQAETQPTPDKNNQKPCSRRKAGSLACESSLFWALLCSIFLTLVLK